MIVRVLAAAGLLFPLPASAADAPLEPTGKWVVNFDDAQCVASRNYGSKESPIHLVLKAPPLGDVLQIGVVREGTVDRARQVDGEIVLGDGHSVQTSLLEYSSPRRQRALYTNLPVEQLAPLRQASTIRIRAHHPGTEVIRSRILVGSSRSDDHFTLAQMQPLLRTIDACVDDLRTVWNVVPRKSGEPNPRLKSAAQGNLAGLFHSGDYPTQAIDKTLSGAVRVAVLIDEKGKVADCTIIETSGAAVLDAQSCAIIRDRANFKPAIGLDGRPAKDSLIQRIRWAVR